MLDEYIEIRFKYVNNNSMNRISEMETAFDESHALNKSLAELRLQHSRYAQVR